jgi:Tol biopolymer transport system component
VNIFEIILNPNDPVYVLAGPFSISLDGTKLAYMDLDQYYLEDIHFYDLKDKNHGIEVESIWMDSNPAYSPDGNYLAFLSDRSGKTEIWIKDRSSGDLKQLTGFHDLYIDSKLTWSPDSKRIYFKLYRDEVYGIYSLGIE